MSTSPTGESAKPALVKRRSIVYIDGYNFYYNAIKRTEFRWLNLEKFVRSFRNNDDIQQIYYFTAMAMGYGSQRRQKAFWRALSTLPLLTIVEGRHKRKDRTCLVEACTHAASKRYESIEEKRTDVNIAVQMVDDAYQNACDTFVLISGDSDLVPAINLIRTRFTEKEVVVYVPNRPDPGEDDDSRDGHHEIRNAATRARDLPLQTLKFAKFPERVQLPGGESVAKPREGGAGGSVQPRKRG